MQKKYIILITTTALAILLAIFMSSQSKDSIEYTPKGENNKAGPVVIKAPENINQNSGTYSIQPTAEGYLQTVDNFIIFWPKEGESFKENQRYTAVFSEYKTVSGETVETVETSFTINRGVDYTPLQKEVLEKYGRFEAEPTNPLLEKLPYTRPYRFKVSYIINDLDSNKGKDLREVLGTKTDWKTKKSNYTVVIETLVFQGQQDTLETYINEVHRARQEALEWITSLGVDVKNDIEYEFIPSDDRLTAPMIREEEIEL